MPQKSQSNYLVLVAVFVLSFEATASRAENPSDSDVRTALAVCGPTSVQHVLRCYGQETDLIDLIKEIQDGDPRAESSMWDLKQALEHKGLHTIAVDVGSLGFVRSHYPAIIHYRRGHFAVIEDVSGFYAKIADVEGIPGTWKLIPEVIRGQSGLVLLTSKKAIPLDAIQFINWLRLAALILGLGLASLLLVRQIAIAALRLKRIDR